MTNEITVFKAITTIGQTISSVAQCIKTNRSIKKQDLVVMQEQLAFIKHACKARAYGELVRLSIDEMSKTLQMINQKGFSADAYDMAIGLLHLQYNALRQNIEKYMM